MEDPLRSYIQAQLARGVKPKAVLDALIKSGWQRDKVIVALRSMGKDVSGIELDLKVGAANIPTALKNEPSKKIVSKFKVAKPFLVIKETGTSQLKVRVVQETRVQSANPKKQLNLRVPSGYESSLPAVEEKKKEWLSLEQRLRVVKLGFRAAWIGLLLVHGVRLYLRNA